MSEERTAFTSLHPPFLSWTPRVPGHPPRPLWAEVRPAYPSNQPSDGRLAANREAVNPSAPIPQRTSHPHGSGGCLDTPPPTISKTPPTHPPMSRRPNTKRIPSPKDQKPKSPKGQNPKSPRALKPKNPTAQRPKNPKAQKENPKSQKLKKRKSQNPKSPKAQSQKNRKSQKPKIPKAQKTKSPKAQKPKGPKDPKVQKPKGPRGPGDSTTPRGRLLHRPGPSSWRQGSMGGCMRVKGVVLERWLSSGIGPGGAAQARPAHWGQKPDPGLTAPSGRLGLRRCSPRDASEGKGPRKRPQKRLGRRLEEVAEAVGGGYCRLQMPLRLALGVGGTVAGHRLRAVEAGGGPPPPMHPCSSPPLCLVPCESAPPPGASLQVSEPNEAPYHPVVRNMVLGAIVALPFYAIGWAFTWGSGSSFIGIHGFFLASPDGDFPGDKGMPRPVPLAGAAQHDEAHAHHRGTTHETEREAHAHPRRWTQTRGADRPTHKHHNSRSHASVQEPPPTKTPPPQRPP